MEGIQRKSAYKQNIRPRPDAPLHLDVNAWKGDRVGEVCLMITAGDADRDYTSAGMMLTLDLTLTEALTLLKELAEGIRTATANPDFKKWLEEEELTLNPRTLEITEA